MTKRFLIRIVIQVFIVIALAGCVTPSISPTPTAFTPVITPEVTRLTPTQAAAEDEPVSPGGENCDAGGTVERYQIDSVFLNIPLFFTVYLPPCYDSSAADGYPVLYALHGQNFTDEMWLDLGLAETAVASWIDPGLTLAAAYLLFILILLFRPQGLFGRQSS